MSTNSRFWSLKSCRKLAVL
jgi:hypothetical protein